MSANLKINNYGSNNLKESTDINANSDADQATVIVASTQNILVGDYVLAGNVGAEKSELRKVLTVDSAISLTMTANFSFPHNRFEKLTSLFGDKIKIYRAANVDGTQPSDASFSVLDTIDIDSDQAYTSYSDAAGGSDYWYKFTYYNSTTTGESSLADSSAARGGQANNYCSIDLIRTEAGLSTNKWVTDADIDIKRQAAQDEVNSALVGLYELPFTDPIPAIIQMITARIAAGLLLISPSGGSYINTFAEGDAKLKQARADLQALQDKTKSVTVNGSSIAIENAGGFSMYPDASTAGLDVTEGGAAFTRADRY